MMKKGEQKEDLSLLLPPKIYMALPLSLYFVILFFVSFLLSKIIGADYEKITVAAFPNVSWGVTGLSINPHGITHDAK